MTGDAPVPSPLSVGDFPRPGITSARALVLAPALSLSTIAAVGFDVIVTSQLWPSRTDSWFRYTWALCVAITFSLHLVSKRQLDNAAAEGWGALDQNLELEAPTTKPHYARTQALREKYPAFIRLAHERPELLWFLGAVKAVFVVSAETAQSAEEKWELLRNLDVVSALGSSPALAILWSALDFSFMGCFYLSVLGRPLYQRTTLAVLALLPVVVGMGIAPLGSSPRWPPLVVSSLAASVLVFALARANLTSTEGSVDEIFCGAAARMEQGIHAHRAEQEALQQQLNAADVRAMQGNQDGRYRPSLAVIRESIPGGEALGQTELANRIDPSKPSLAPDPLQQLIPKTSRPSLAAAPRGSGGPLGPGGGQPASLTSSNAHASQSHLMSHNETPGPSHASHVGRSQKSVGRSQKSQTGVGSQSSGPKKGGSSQESGPKKVPSSPKAPATSHTARRSQDNSQQLESRPSSPRTIEVSEQVGAKHSFLRAARHERAAVAVVCVRNAAEKYTLAAGFAAAGAPGIVSTVDFASQGQSTAALLEGAAVLALLAAAAEVVLCLPEIESVERVLVKVRIRETARGVSRRAMQSERSDQRALLLTFTAALYSALHASALARGLAGQADCALAMEDFRIQLKWAVPVPLALISFGALALCPSRRFCKKTQLTAAIAAVMIVVLFTVLSHVDVLGCGVTPDAAQAISERLSPFLMLGCVGLRQYLAHQGTAGLAQDLAAQAHFDQIARLAQEARVVGKKKKAGKARRSGSGRPR